MAFNSLGTIIWFIGTIINVLFYANKANAVCVYKELFSVCNILTQHCFVHFVNLEDEVKKNWHGCKKVFCCWFVLKNEQTKECVAFVTVSSLEV